MWKPACGQDDAIQMDAYAMHLHVANSHLPVNAEPWEMLHPLDMMGEKEGMNEKEEGGEWGDKNC